MHYPVIIIGGGPAGLSCATTIANHGKDVLLLERKSKIGPKVCAGGITWSGLINTLPGHVEEKRFPSQHIVSRLQHAIITEQQPIIATINRERLGAHMAEIAKKAGAQIRTSCRVKQINTKSITYVEEESGAEYTATFDHLIGADGATSIVRRHLGVPSERKGIGINYQVPGNADSMEWHLDINKFGNGYGWIFPHLETISIGAYVDGAQMSGKQLKEGLIDWAGVCGYDLRNYQARSEYINFDYRGWKFGDIFLIGEAAGLASGLTGEGIYPAIKSGQYIGNYVADVKCDMNELERLIKVQKAHAKLVKFTGRTRLLTLLLAELATLGLRSGLLDFRKLEMARLL